MVPFGVKIELHGADFLRNRKIQGTMMGDTRFRVDMPRLLSINGVVALENGEAAGSAANRVLKGPPAQRR
jgi:Zn-dependent alcohol dehydrogenase